MVIHKKYIWRDNINKDELYQAISLRSAALEVTTAAALLILGGIKGFIVRAGVVQFKDPILTFTTRRRTVLQQSEHTHVGSNSTMHGRFFLPRFRLLLRETLGFALELHSSKTNRFNQLCHQHSLTQFSDSCRAKSTKTRLLAQVVWGLVGRLGRKV